MSQAQLQLQVRNAGAGVVVVDVRGDFTAAAEPALMEAYASASDGGARALIFNFVNLEYMNSSGIGLLITLLIRANRLGQRLLACGLSEHYRHIFALTRLDEAIGIHATEADAMTATGA